MKCPKCNSQMTLFGSKIFEGAMICNDCYEKLSVAKSEEPPQQQILPQSLPKYSPVPHQQPVQPVYPQRATGGRVLGNIVKEKPVPEAVPIVKEQPQATAPRRMGRKTEPLTPLTPTKLTGIIKAQQKKEQKEQPEKERDFTPLSPNEFVGLFGGHKKEEFIEPQQKEEDFTPLTPDKYSLYQPESQEEGGMETSLAETVGKFVSPPRLPSPPQEGRDEYVERLAPPRRKFPDLKLLSPKPLAPIKPKEQQYVAPQPEILEEICEGLEELSQKQEILGSYLVELYQRVDYQTKLLEEIYRALGGYLEESY